VGRSAVLTTTKQLAARVEVGVSSLGFSRALATTLSGLSLPKAESLDAAFGLACRVILVVGTGVDPVASIRNSARERCSHLLVVCEHAEGSEVARWARAGVTHCFVGEASLIELRSALQSSTAPAVSLDARGLAIEIAGVRTRLTKTQFQLFQYLTAKSGQWVAPSELVTQALGTHHRTDSALIRVHIHAIRRALGTLAPLIESDPARARGYRFRSDLAQSASAVAAFGEPSKL
jgi:DNA-binding response OmpR family regulator